MPSAAEMEDRELFLRFAGSEKAAFGTLPGTVRTYLAHVEGRLGIRVIARLRGCAPSTVTRQVRRVEARREDPLFDAALADWAERFRSTDVHQFETGDWARMFAPTAKTAIESFDDRCAREARRILRRLCEKDAFLAVAEGMEKAVVMRESVPGRHTRTAVVDRDVAKRFAVDEWIACAQAGRVARYLITDVGRAALKRLLEAERRARGQAQTGFAEVVTPFRAQHQEPGERRVTAEDGCGVVRLRTNLAESPLTILGRKRDRAGEPYLSPEMIDAGERLREDFELAQMGPRVTQNWEAFLTPRAEMRSPGRGPAEGPQGARDRVSDALEVLGPGLADVTLRVCCFLEGLEAAEKRLGWTARSGKIVLRIALQRLAQFYGITPPPGR